MWWNSPAVMQRCLHEAYLVHKLRQGDSRTPCQTAIAAVDPG